MASTRNTPLSGTTAQFRMIMRIGEYISQTKEIDLSNYVLRGDIQGFINNGYMAKIQVTNPNFAVIDQLVNDTYLLDKLRRVPIEIEFQIINIPSGIPAPKGMTRPIKGYLSMIHSHGKNNVDRVEFIVIDKLSWAMRIGDASGGAYEGTVSEVISQLFKKYAPGLTVTIPKTDDKRTVWWQMRRHPRDMISHLMYLASSLTSAKSPWVMGIRNEDVYVGPLINNVNPSQSIAYYRKASKGVEENDIFRWRATLNHSIGHYESGLVTAGVTATLGQIYDMTNQPKEAIVGEINTNGKYVPFNPKTAARATTRSLSATYDPMRFGRTFVPSPPEYFSGGEIGSKYLEYFDAYARSEYMKDIYKLFTMDLQIAGHGIWDTTMGLGSNTVYIDWNNEFTDVNKSYFLGGNWLVYGWRHLYRNGVWRSVVKLSKPDRNSTGQVVGLGRTNN